MADEPDEDLNGEMVEKIETLLEPLELPDQFEVLERALTGLIASGCNSDCRAELLLDMVERIREFCVAIDEELESASGLDGADRNAPQ